MILLLNRLQWSVWLIVLLIILLFISIKSSRKLKIILLGDSITDRGFLKGGFAALLMKHQSDEWHKKYELVNAGVGGDKISGLVHRLQADVIAKHPSKVFILIGINDVWHRRHSAAVGTEISDFELQYKLLIETLLREQILPVLCTTTRPDPGCWPEEAETELAELNNIIRHLAAVYGCFCCDLYTAFTPAPDIEWIPYTTDGVHLNETGNRLVAQRISAFLHL